MGKKSHAESEVERIAQRLWMRAASSPSRPVDAWYQVQNHLWGVSDGLRIAGKTAAGQLADDLGFLAGEIAFLALEAEWS